jgi:uncharacterized membrane protein YphA (DoxX/SURF4 family)
MRSKEFGWSASSILLALSGIILIGVGCYFLFLRPALLPEDIRYMSLTPAELESIGPRLARWLAHLFNVMGGYVMATGVLTLTLAVTAFRQRSTLALAGAIVAGVVSIGRQRYDQLGLQMGTARICAHLGCKHRSLRRGSSPGLHQLRSLMSALGH